MFEGFYGNGRVIAALERMIAQERIPQTILLAGPEGVGKATLARRFAACLVGGAGKIEKDDLRLPENVALIQEREKWPTDKRTEEPLFFASHPDFVTFPPDGPLRQISIQQMRLVKERAQYKPDRGNRRVFLIDHLDRASEQAANSLLKILEEPPEHLILVLTAENAHDLLPTIRSRAVPFYLSPLSRDEMSQFVATRQLDQPERRLTLACGSPGAAVSLDLGEYDRRKNAMCTLLRTAAGILPFSSWVEQSDSVLAGREDKLEGHLKVLYVLLGDLLAVREGSGEIRNPELKDELDQLASRVSFGWVRAAVEKVTDLMALLRRNIQKGIALDALVLELRP